MYCLKQLKVLLTNYLYERGTLCSFICTLMLIQNMTKKTKNKNKNKNKSILYKQERKTGMTKIIEINIERKIIKINKLIRWVVIYLFIFFILKIFQSLNIVLCIYRYQKKKIV